MGRRSAHEVMEVSDDRASHLQWFVSLNILNEILDSLCFRARCILHSFIHQLHCSTILQYNIHLSNWHFPHIHKAHQVHIGSCFVSDVVQANTPLSWSSGTLASPLSWQPLHSAPTDPHQAQDHLSKRGSKDWLRAFGHPSWCANILRRFFPSNNMTNQ